MVVDEDWGLTTRGMVLNLKSFEGPIYFEENTVTECHIHLQHCDMLDEDHAGLTETDG